MWKRGAMTYSFKLIEANDRENEHLLRSMHRLRKTVFYDELKWSVGLNIINDMEFDEYDRPGTKYIVRINEEGEVDATCRIIPTDTPYMIADHYPEFIDKIPMPNTNYIWEMSRFCASQEARKSSKGKVPGEIIAAAIEFGLVNNIKNYVALATDTVVPVIQRIVGWDPQKLSERKKTPDDYSYAVIYTVSLEMLIKIRTKNNVQGTLLIEVGMQNETQSEEYTRIAA